MFQGNINDLTVKNTDFRQVVWTGENSQLVLMSIPVDEQIDEEIHHDVDQLLFFVEGMGEAILDGQVNLFHPGQVLIVPAGVVHTIMNTGDTELKLYTVYAPQEHPADTVHATKADAKKAALTDF